jgi:eukaryotic-like serine/threonine-protein kinase
MVGEVIAGRYELEELVGTGGMSSVYRALDTLLERHVALKILHATYGADEETVERFRREARAVAQLSHPNIVTVIDRGEDAGRQFIVFEYVAGENLKQLVQREGPLPVRRALELTLEVAGGLAFAHEQGLVHRDVKPQNVLMNGDDRAKVTDFGIARSLDVDHGMTQTGTVLGTSNYIAPEQASGEPVDAYTDVYSLGVVLFELLTGDVPYDGDNFLAVAMRHLNDPVPDVRERRRDVSPRVAAAVARAMAKDPEERFPSMDAFAAELEACLVELERGEEGPGPGDAAATQIVPPRVVRETRPRPARARRRRSAWPALLLAVGILALAGVAAFALLAGGELPGGLEGGQGNDGQAQGEQAGPVQLQGVRAWDPHGDDREHDDTAPQATDGNADTFWRTERYRASFSAIGKPGVGLVLDAGEPVELAEIVVASSTPGFTAEIHAGDSLEGPFDRVVSSSQAAGETTAFPIEGEAARFYLLWITELSGPRAEIRNVTAERR